MQLLVQLMSCCICLIVFHKLEFFSRKGEGFFTLDQELIRKLFGAFLFFIFGEIVGGSAARLQLL